MKILQSTLKKVTTLFTLIILFLFSGQVNGQINNYIYKANLDSFLNAEFGFEHTFIHAENVNEPKLNCDSIIESDNEDYSRFKVIDFTDNIISLIPKETNVVIISENHLIYQSRILFKEFFRKLKANGFSTIYIEALDLDIDLVERGYPNRNTGYLINEPVFGNLIRDLIEQDFTIYPYEELEFQKKNSKNEVTRYLNKERELKDIEREEINQDQYNLEFMSPWFDMSGRDYSQYNNIMQTFDPSKKSIILCGHAHGMKIPYGGWRSLGFWLSLNKNVRFFSIENSEAIYQTDEILNKITCHFDNDVPFILKDTLMNNYYNEKRYQPYEKKDVGNLFDMSVFYPVNYSSKVYNDNSNQVDCEEFTVDMTEYNSPLLVIKYVESEYNIEQENAIPTDIRVVKSRTYKIQVCENEKVFIWDGLIKREVGK